VREYSIRTDAREQMLDITSRVAEAVRDMEIVHGMAVIYSPHTTAGVTVNENADPDVARDILETLRRLVPRDAGFQHREGNADAHVKASLMGSSASIPIADGRLVLGRWQGVYFCEFDGPRNRRFVVRVVAS